MAVSNGSIEVRGDFFALHLLVDNPTFQRFAEDNDQCFFLIDAIWQGFIRWLLFLPSLYFRLHLGRKWSLSLHSLVYQVAKNGIHWHGASIVIGILQTGKCLLPTASCHHLHCGYKEHHEQGAEVLLESQSIAGLGCLGY